jgi:hypothetical protein
MNPQPPSVENDPFAFLHSRASCQQGKSSVEIQNTTRMEMEETNNLVSIRLDKLRATKGVWRNVSLPQKWNGRAQVSTTAEDRTVIEWHDNCVSATRLYVVRRKVEGAMGKQDQEMMYRAKEVISWYRADKWAAGSVIVQRKWKRRKVNASVNEVVEILSTIREIHLQVIMLAIKETISRCRTACTRSDAPPAISMPVDVVHRKQRIRI